MTNEISICACCYICHLLHLNTLALPACLSSLCPWIPIHRNLKEEGWRFNPCCNSCLCWKDSDFEGLMQWNFMSARSSFIHSWVNLLNMVSLDTSLLWLPRLNISSHNDYSSSNLSEMMKIWNEAFRHMLYTNSHEIWRFTSWTCDDIGDRSIWSVFKGGLVITYYVTWFAASYFMELIGQNEGFRKL